MILCIFKRREVLRGCSFILWIRNLIEVRKTPTALQIRKVQTFKSYRIKNILKLKWEYFWYGQTSKNSSDPFTLTTIFPDLDDVEIFT